MKYAALISLVVLLGGCVDMPEVNEVDQAISDFVIVGELESLDSIRLRERDSWYRITDYFVMYKTRDGEYLFEFARPCRELRDPSRVTPDARHDNRIRAGFDTLRGCRIHRIYGLDEGQAEEVRRLGG